MCAESVSPLFTCEESDFHLWTECFLLFCCLLLLFNSFCINNKHDTTMSGIIFDLLFDCRGQIPKSPLLQYAATTTPAKSLKTNFKGSFVCFSSSLLQKFGKLSAKSSIFLNIEKTEQYFVVKTSVQMFFANSLKCL